MQLLLHGVHQPLGMPFGVLYFEILQRLGTVYTGALQRKFEQLGLFAALGHGKRHTVEEHRGRGQHRHDHFARELARDRLDDMGYRSREQFLFGAVGTGRHAHRSDGDDRTVAQTQKVAIGRVVVCQKREYVAVDDLGTDDDRARLIVVQRRQTRLAALCGLEAQLSGGTRHFGFEMRAHGAQISAQDRLHQSDALVVILLALGAHARSLAVAQMILQAHAVTSARYGLRRKVELARAQRHHFADELQQSMLRRERTVGAVVLRPVAHQPSRRLHPRKRLAPHDDPRICLIVFEQDIVARLQALYQGVFEQQSILLGVDDDMAHLDDLLDHNAHLGRMVAALQEIRRHAPAQRLGLADVYYRTSPVDELVYARIRRQRGGLSFERLKYLFVTIHCANLQKVMRSIRSTAKDNAILPTRSMFRPPKCHK